MGELSVGYYQQYLEAQRSHWWFRARQRILQTLMPPPLRELGAIRLIDLGSGPGGPARTLFRDGWLMACDVATQPLNAYPEADGRVVANATHVPCRTGSLDVVCAFDLLEHLDDDLEALREWRRILKPDGWMMLTVPAHPSLWSSHDEVNAHRRRYRRAELRRVLVSAGFEVVRLTHFNTLLLPGIALVRWGERLTSRPVQGVRPQGHGDLDFQKRFPRWLERCFEELFSLETFWLRQRNFPLGVSLGAVARANGRSGG